jgi:hypothetical protein
MERLIAYLLEVVLVSGMLTAYYWVALRNRKLHGYNRGYLLGVLVLSLVLPLVKIGWSPFAFTEGRVLGEAVQRVEGLGHATVRGAGAATACYWVCGAVSLALLAVSLHRVFAVCGLRRREIPLSMEGYLFIETDDSRAPFSFLSNLFWRRGVDRDDPVNARILRHELAHIHGRHSWDSLFAQGLCSVFWMNPFFWIVRRELSVVHEFIADAATGMEGDAEGFARMLLQSMNEGRFLEPVQGFFQSPIKRRLIMLSKTQSSRLRFWRVALVLPVVAGVVIFVSCRKDQGPLLAEKKIPEIKFDSLDLVKLNLKKKQDERSALMLVNTADGKKRLMQVFYVVGKQGPRDGKEPITISGKKQIMEVQFQKLAAEKIVSDQQK